MTATFIIAKIMMYASSVSEGCSELRRCNIDRGYSLDMDYLFRFDGLRVLGRVFNVPPVIQVEREYEVIIRFLNPCFIIPLLTLCKKFYLESLSDIGTGIVTEIHDYGEILTSWGPSDCPWSGCGVKRPEYYLTMELLQNGKMPVGCFVHRQTEISDGIVHEVSIDPTLDEASVNELGIKSSELIVKFPKRESPTGDAELLSTIQDGKRKVYGAKIAGCRIYSTWDAWRMSVK